MTGKPEGLVIPVVEPLGSPHGWTGEVVRRTQDAVPPEVGRLVLTPASVSDVLTCGWLWQGKEIVTAMLHNVF